MTETYKHTMSLNRQGPNFRLMYNWLILDPLFQRDKALEFKPNIRTDISNYSVASLLKKNNFTLNMYECQAYFQSKCKCKILNYKRVP